MRTLNISDEDVFNLIHVYRTYLKDITTYSGFSEVLYEDLLDLEAQINLEKDIDKDLNDDYGYNGN